MVRHYCDRCECELGNLPFAKMFIDITLNINEDTGTRQARKKEYCRACYSKIMTLIEGEE